MAARVIRVTEFPFDLFGSGGSADGARLLYDAVEEMLEDAADPRSRTSILADRVLLDSVTLATVEDLAGWEELGRASTPFVNDDSTFCLWLTGNHLGAVPVLESLDRRTAIVQFDAHLDAFDLEDTSDELSPGNFLLREGLRDRTIVHVGFRDLFVRPTHEAVTLAGIVTADEIHRNPETWTKSLLSAIPSDGPVWLDLDVDFFDPSDMPAVHVPVAMGPPRGAILQAFEAIGWDRMKGMSISEFDPGRDRNDVGTRMLLWLIEYVMLRIAECDAASKRPTGRRRRGST